MRSSFEGGGIETSSASGLASPFPGLLLHPTLDRLSRPHHHLGRQTPITTNNTITECPDISRAIQLRREGSASVQPPAPSSSPRPRLPHPSLSPAPGSASRSPHGRHLCKHLEYLTTTPFQRNPIRYVPTTSIPSALRPLSALRTTTPTTTTTTTPSADIDNFTFLFFTIITRVNERVAWHALCSTGGASPAAVHTPCFQPNTPLPDHHPLCLRQPQKPQLTPLFSSRPSSSFSTYLLVGRPLIPPNPPSTRVSLADTRVHS